MVLLVELVTRSEGLGNLRVQPPPTMSQHNETNVCANPPTTSGRAAKLATTSYGQDFLRYVPKKGGFRGFLKIILVFARQHFRLLEVRQVLDQHSELNVHAKIYLRRDLVRVFGTEEVVGIGVVDEFGAPEHGVAANHVAVRREGDGMPT